MNLQQIPGEGPGELVFTARRMRWTIYVKREYETGPWDWTIIEGADDPIAFGDATSKEDATDQVLAYLDGLCPEAPPRAGGLVGMVGRLLWGDDARGE